MRVTFKSSQHSIKTNVLELVHSDVCDPMKTKSLGGASYFITFIDDHSRKIWVYNLKTKDQVLQVFNQFHAFVEREFGEKLNALKLIMKVSIMDFFYEYYKTHGIGHQKKPFKTRQLNGIVIERLNID